MTTPTKDSTPSSPELSPRLPQSPLSGVSTMIDSGTDSRDFTENVEDRAERERQEVYNPDPEWNWPGGYSRNEFQATAQGAITPEASDDEEIPPSQVAPEDMPNIFYASKGNVIGFQAEKR